MVNDGDPKLAKSAEKIEIVHSIHAGNSATQAGTTTRPKAKRSKRGKDEELPASGEDMETVL